MPIVIEWYDDSKKIILGHVMTSLGWDEPKQARLKIKDLAQSVTYPVALIAILSPNLSVPPTGFTENSEETINNHTLLGLHTVIYVTKTPTMKVLWQSVIDIYGDASVAYHIVPTLDDALAILA